jgi:ferredoxin-type protein NapH
MIWFLPLIIIGGLFIPLLGYLVLLMMVFFLILSYFRGRYWCAHLCPRGSFLDLALSKLSLKRKMPRFLSNRTFRWTVVVLFMAFFVFQLVGAPKTVAGIGFVFVRMCLLTTLLSVVLGVPIHHRTWCTFCPMGTLQGRLGTLRMKKAK